MRLLLMGAPGSGKGTQSLGLARALNVPAISTGDIFRENVRHGTALGQRAKRFMDAGEYVPDDLTNMLVRGRLESPDAHEGFILDGYPRTLTQVAVLDSILRETSAPLAAVVVLDVDEQELVSRLMRRARLENRTDDTEDVFRRRQLLYAAETAPLIEQYEKRGICVRVDGHGDPSQVNEHIVRELASLDAFAQGGAGTTTA